MCQAHTQAVVLNNATNSFHRITEQLRLEGTFGDHLVQLPLAQARHLELVVQDRVH